MLERDFDWNGHFAKIPLDVRRSENARWIDQKCSVDVVCTVADCILQYGLAHSGRLMRSADVWASEYAMQYVPAAFKKPGLDDENARHEYDKFFQQPMELLAYAGVLKRVKDGHLNYYSVANPEVLEHVSYRERNTLDFLVAYIWAVVSQSGLSSTFERFFANPNADRYDAVKDAFVEFTIRYTPINGTTECRRIFTKVLNPLAFARHTPGTERGRLSRDVITQDMLMYNRDNFRDIYAGKPKGVPRIAWAEQVGLVPNAAYALYQSQKAKRELKEFNDLYRGGRSEMLTGPYVEGLARDMHHIFPVSRFPEIAGSLENIIALTPNQHSLGAHAGGTNRVERAYQKLLLDAKTAAVEDNLTGTGVPTIYSFGGLQEVLHVGLEDEYFLEIPENDFVEVARETELHYRA